MGCDRVTQRRICAFLVTLCLLLGRLCNKQRRLFSLLNPGTLVIICKNVENDALLQRIPLQTCLKLVSAQILPRCSLQLEISANLCISCFSFWINYGMEILCRAKVVQLHRNQLQYWKQQNLCGYQPECFQNLSVLSWWVNARPLLWVTVSCHRCACWVIIALQSFEELNVSCISAEGPQESKVTWICLQRDWIAEACVSWDLSLMLSCRRIA